MISVEEARSRILASLMPLGSEQIGLASALGRVLAEDLDARVTQPPAAVSAMDGYAVRSSDVATVPVRLRIVGAAPAGKAHAGTVGAGEAVRIFTGGPVPDGSDTIVIQENTRTEGDHVVVTEPSLAGRHIRVAGLDFRAGQVGLERGRRLTARDVALAAAMDRPWLRVHRRPRIAILSSGDEIVMPGEPRGPNQIVSSNGVGLAALVGASGGDPVDLGVAPDDVQALQSLAAGASAADMLVTTGGASVGEHDLMRQALAARGMTLDFWKIAMRPGKPLMYGRIGDTPVLGLPGNPVSTFVCAMIFLQPALAALEGVRNPVPPMETARLGADLAANDGREDYMRAHLDHGPDGLVATAMTPQDSSMLRFLAAAGCLIRRPAGDGPVKAGSPVSIVRFDTGVLRT